MSSLMLPALLIPNSIRCCDVGFDFQSVLDYQSNQFTVECWRVLSMCCVGLILFHGDASWHSIRYSSRLCRLFLSFFCQCASSLRDAVSILPLVSTTLSSLSKKIFFFWCWWCSCRCDDDTSFRDETALSSNYYLSFHQCNLPSNDVVSSFFLLCSWCSLLDPNCLCYSCSCVVFLHSLWLVALTVQVGFSFL